MGDFIQALAVVLVGGGTIYAAIRQINSQRRIATRQATFETIFKHEIQSPQWPKLGQDADFVLRNPEQWDLLIKRRANRELLVATLSFLNYFEIIAVGIEEGTLSETLYRKWYESGYTSTWKLAAPFVLRWRAQEGRERAFVKFEALAKRWIESDPCRKTRDAQPRGSAY